MIAECKGLHPTNPNRVLRRDQRRRARLIRRRSVRATPPTPPRRRTAPARRTSSCSPRCRTSTWAAARPTPCSLVVVPSQGGDSLDFAKPDCSNHTEDVGGTDLGQYAFSPITSAPFTANGLLLVGEADRDPAVLRAHAERLPAARGELHSPAARRCWPTRWSSGRPASASAATRSSMQYNGSLERERGADYFAAGTDDVAFTTLPMTGPTKTRTRTRRSPFRRRRSATGWTTRTPASRTRTSSWTPGCCQDADHLLRLHRRRLPERRELGVRLRQRGGQQPENLYADPEFQKLNPTVWQNASQPSGYEIPTCCPATAT